MSLLPYVFGYDWPRSPHRLFDQHFGLAITPGDLLTATRPIISQDYFRPWRQLAELSADVGSTIKADKDKFQINLDVQQFAPEEISVKTAEGCVVIEGKHEEKKDEHGYISRQFVRRYRMPEGCKIEGVESRLSSDGVLTVTAPREVSVIEDRAVPIQQTGPVRKETKEGRKEVESKK